MMNLQRTFVLALIFLAALCWGHHARAQEETETIKPKLRLNYTKQADSMNVRADAYYMQEGEKGFCEGATVHFYPSEESNKPLQSLVINEEGQAFLKLDPQRIRDFEQAPGHYFFYARLEPDDRFRERDEDLSVLNARMQVEYLEGDSINQVEVTFLGVQDSTGDMGPVKDVPVKCFVKRTLTKLQVGDRFTYTDSTGRAKFTIPADIPGDENSGLTIVVMVDEHNDFGTVLYEGSVNWGKPVQAKSPISERTLIGARDNAPWFMIIGINAMLLGIWVFIGYVIYCMIKIRKLGRHADIENNS